MEIPKPPPTLVQRLQEHDKSLGIRFSVVEGLWEITEELPGGRISHCFFWHDGDWANRKYKALPHSAEPLLTKLGVIDWGRSGGNPMRRYREFVARGQEKRAALILKANEEFKVRLREYARWFQKNWVAVSRQHQMGGASRKKAIRTRLDAIREILYAGKLPEHRY